MRKLSFITVPFIATSILITGCGGSATDTTTSENNSQAIVIVPPTSSTPSVTESIPTTINSKTISLLGVTGKSQVIRQAVEGVTKLEKAIVDAQFSNATGNFVYKTSLSNAVGNLTFEVNVEEPNGITDISLYLPDVEQSISLCSSDCGLNFTKTMIGFNPQLSGIQAGNLRVELFVTDNEQNTAMIDVLTIDWHPIQISAINAARANDKISLNWEGESSLNRYNVYASTEPNLTPENAMSLTNGFQQLAITSTEIEIDDQSPAENYYVLITGLNESGESGLSTPIKIASTLVVPNQAPFAVTDNIIVNEDSNVNSNILTNDVDPENKSITIASIITQPSNGVLTSQSNGEVSYTPNVNFSGNDSFRYEIVDSANNTSQAVVLITVNNINDVPEATDDILNLEIDNTLTVPKNGLTSNDFDIDGDFLFVDITPITPPSHGTLQLNSDGSLTYTDNGTFVSSDSFEYQITDNNGGTSTAKVTLLSAGNDTVPVAVNDSFTVDEDTTLNTIASNSVLANDTDPNLLAFTLSNTLIETTSHGTLNLATDGTFTYMPDADFNGIDSFQYEIENTLGFKSQGFASIVVKPIAEIPVANDDNYQTNEDITLNIDASNGLLANDSDMDGGTLTVNLSPEIPPQQGQVSLNLDGSFSYIPDTFFNGIDSFTYQVLSSTGTTTTAKAIITITAINNSPQVVDDSGSTQSDTPLTLNVIANDTDIESDPLTITAASTAPANGTVAIIGNQIRYTPISTYFGTATISYTIEDPAGEQSSGTAHVTVSLAGGSNNNPVATDETYTVNEDTELNGSTVLSNDTDDDGGTLSALTTPLTNVSNGTLVLASDGTFTYMPLPHFNGSDSFVYTVIDGQGGFANAQVNITVTSVNDIPVALTDTYSTLENTSFTITADDFNALLVNDFDNDGDTLTVNMSASIDPTSGTLSLATDGEFTYTPTTNFSGTDSFNYQLEDSNGGSVSGLVNITIVNVNNAPVTLADNYSMTQNTVFNATTVLDNDTDADGDTLTVDTSFTSLPSNGTVVFSTDGTFVYTPIESFVGADSFTYKVDDGNGEQTQGLVHITVEADPALQNLPKAFSDSYTLDEDTTLSGLSVKANDIVNQSNPSHVLLWVASTPEVAPQHGTLVMQINGTFTYTPNANYSGADSFQYKITNFFGKTDIGLVNITINPLDDDPIANDDSFTTRKNKKFDDTLLLDNDIDTDPNYGHLHVDTTPFVNVQHGTLKLRKHGEVEYTPDNGYVGTDSFIYRVFQKDNESSSALATVTITVTN